MKLIYVAGPFRGPTAWDIECNVRRAEEIGYEVARCGAMPVIPHANTRFSHGQGPDEFWLDGTLELARRCDGLILVPNWDRSTGTRDEIAAMLGDGKPVFHTIAELAHWLRKAGPSAPPPRT
jgi:hypothetical protein